MTELQHGMVDKLLTMANDLKGEIIETQAHLRVDGHNRDDKAVTAELWLEDAVGLLQYVIRNLVRAHNEVIDA